ncbi:ABC transporter substrate-binding protein, partial [Rhizobium leguminosarum]
MTSRLATLLCTAAAIMASTAIAPAQTVLKWAHVYETSEPFPTDSVWAAEEINKRTEGRYKIEV